MLDSKLSTLATCCILLTLFCQPYSVAQNMIPNGSFEQFDNCPMGLDEIDEVEAWSQSRGTCDYFHECGVNGASVPFNVLGHQEALEGEGYAGFIAFDFPDDGYREHLIIELSEPLSVGEQYYFSMYLSNGFGYSNNPSASKACNGQGVLLSTVEYSSLWDDNPLDAPSPVDNTAHILNLEIINDSINWVPIQDSFIADSAYQYLIIGSFLDEQSIDHINVTGEGPFETYGEAYYFVDEVRLGTDSTYVFENITSVQEGIASDISVWPTIISDEMTIRSSQPLSKLEVIDTSGRLVFNQDLCCQKLLKIPIPNLAHGYFVVRIEDINGKSSIVRVVITQ